MPCITTWTTKNRPVLSNHYATWTLLVDQDAYCPCGPNHPNYSYRSRIYNPDPKYQPHLDNTDWTYDSIPKDKSCGNYGRPAPPGFNNGGGLPCYSSPNRGCWPPINPDRICCMPYPPPDRCKRRRIKPPSWACCKKPKMPWKQWICLYKNEQQQRRDCCQQQQAKLEEAFNNPEPEEEEPEPEEPYDPQVESEGGYSLEIPRENNLGGNRVSYNCGNTGNCYMRTDGGCCEMTKMNNNGMIVVETDPCGGYYSQALGGSICC